MNQIILVGNLTKDATQIPTKTGNPGMKFSMATNRRVKDQQVTSFHQVIVWGQWAESTGPLLRKGAQVVVFGRVETRSYVDKKSGETKYITEVTAEELYPVARVHSVPDDGPDYDSQY